MKKMTGNRKPKSEVVRVLHIGMIILCVLASVTLLFIDSIFNRVIISGLLIAYAIFLLKNTHILLLIFKLSPNETTIDYSKVHMWDSKKSTYEKSQDQQKQKTSASEQKKNSSSGKWRDQPSIESISKSFFKDQTFSSFKGMSTSHMNDSYTSNLRRSKLETRGFDLGQLSFMTEKSDTKSMSKSSISSEKTFQIMDRKAIARKKHNVYQVQSEKGYEQQLIETKKSHKQIVAKYKVILNSIYNIVNPLLNQHKSNTAKFQQLLFQYLDLSIDTKLADVSLPQFDRIWLGQKNRVVSFQALIAKLLHFYGRKTPLELSKIPLKNNKKWNDFQKKSGELIRSRLRIGESLGLTSANLSSSIRKGAQQFVEKYNKYFSMIELYIRIDLQNKNSNDLSQDETNDDNLEEEFKSRILILHIYIKHLNKILQNYTKINLKDCIGLSQQSTTDDKISLQITPKYFFDAYIPYFNLYQMEKGQKKKCYPCEYGNNNYLSIIYFILFSLNKKSNQLKSKPEISKIIYDVL